MNVYVWPNGVPISECEWRPISNSESTPSTFVGGSQNASRPGDRFGCTVRVNNATGAQRRKLLALAALLRGSANHVYVPDHAFPRSGAWVGGELFTNANLSSVTGWTVSTGSIAATDDAIRVKSTSSAGPELRQSVALTQYAPHVIRSLTVAGQGSAASQYALQIAHESTSGIFARGYNKLVAVPLSGSAANQWPYFLAASPNVAGDFDDVHFASLSRCLLVDGGGNALLRSKEFDNASWDKGGATITQNAVTSPDGTVTADWLVDSSSTNHLVSQAATFSSDADDFSLSCSVAAGARTWVALQLLEATSSSTVTVYANLSTGVLGSFSTSGANWSNERANIVDKGGGWYRITLIARKTNAATSVRGYVLAAEADLDVTFAAASGNAIAIWEANLKQDSVTTRGSSTTSAAIAAQTHAAGASAVYVKGGPASMQGLLRIGDAFELDNLTRFATAPLDLDAAGCGYLQFEPSLARAVSDNAPIILENPMSRMKLVNMVEIPCRPGGWSDFDFEFEQALQTS